METSYKYTGAANTMYLTIFEAKFIYCSIQYGNRKTIFSLDLFDLALSFAVVLRLQITCFMATTI